MYSMCNNIKVYVHHVKRAFSKINKKYFLMNYEEKQIERSDGATDYKCWRKSILMHSLTNLQKLGLENRHGMQV